MKSKEQLQLENIYSNLEKEKQVVSEDANEGLGASIVYLVIFGIPVVMDFFSRKYPELKEKFEQIKLDIKNNKETQQQLKDQLKRTKQDSQNLKTFETKRREDLGLKPRDY